MLLNDYTLVKMCFPLKLKFSSCERACFYGNENVLTNCIAHNFPLPWKQPNINLRLNGSVIQQLASTNEFKIMSYLIVIIIYFQNCQRDLKRLREKELNLQTDLAIATKEILRLRDLLKDYSPNGERSPL